MVVRIDEETLLDDLELSVRLDRCLRNLHEERFAAVGIKNSQNIPPPKIKDFLHYTEAELLRTPNFGRKSYKEWASIVKSVLDPDNALSEEEVATIQAMKRMRNAVRRIGGYHRALADCYNDLANLILPVK